MANSHEPSYYEIALTNRQVVVAFIILLVCLVTAFFSGVYIGREGTLRDQDQLVRATPPAQKPVDQEGRELEEFEFFGGEGSGQPASSKLPEETAFEEEPEPEPSPADSTLLEDFGGEEVAEAEEPVPAEEEGFLEEEPAPEPEPEPTPARPRRNREEPRQAAAPPGQEAPAPPAAPAAAKGKVVIQVFSSAEQDQAERIQRQLTGGGQSAYLSPVKVGGTTMYRVRIGPFDSRADANKVAERVRKDHKLDTWITEE